jgi:hypothetical protein
LTADSEKQKHAYLSTTNGILQLTVSQQLSAAAYCMSSSSLQLKMSQQLMAGRYPAADSIS